MTDPELVAFLSLVAPRLGLRAAGFRRVRGTVRKRLSRRLAELGLDLAAYTVHLETHPDEWQWLDRSCRITISRFGRDAAVFERLATHVLPERVSQWPGRRIARTTRTAASAEVAAGHLVLNLEQVVAADVAAALAGLGK